MWSQYLDEPGCLRLREVPVPELGPTDVLVAVRTALTCGTDLKTYRRGHPLIPTPTPFGHEFAGEIVAVGRDVTRYRPGDRIASVHTAPCGRCTACERGRENLCTELVRSMVLGAYAEFIRLPARIHEVNAFTMPPGMSYETAALLEPLSCVMHGMSRLNVVLQSTRAVVIGAGPIGLLFLQTLRAAGAQVLVLARRALRLEAARRLGAEQVVDVEAADARAAVLAWTQGLGADLIVECTGRPDVWTRTSEIVCPGGSILLFGGCPAGSRVPFDAHKLHYDEVSVLGAFHFRPQDVARAFEMLAAGRIDVAPLITARIGLGELQTGLDRLAAGEAIKLAVTPARQAPPG